MSTDRKTASSTRRWLSVLLIIHLASFLLSLISYIPIPNGWIYWIRKALSVGIILCLFLLTPANLRYRKAAFFRTAVFCCAMLSLLIPLPAVDLILGLALAVLSVVACWFEYTSHGGLTAAAPGVTRGWRALFFVSLAVSLLTWIATLVLALLPGGILMAAATVTSTVTTVLTDVLELAYLLLLFFTLRKVN